MTELLVLPVHFMSGHLSEGKCRLNYLDIVFTSASMLLEYLIMVVSSSAWFS